jgi:hypothetical protein
MPIRPPSRPVSVSNSTTTPNSPPQQMAIDRPSGLKQKLLTPLPTLIARCSDNRSPDSGIASTSTGPGPPPRIRRSTRRATVTTASTSAITPETNVAVPTASPRGTVVDSDHVARPSTTEATTNVRKSRTQRMRFCVHRLRPRRSSQEAPLRRLPLGAAGRTGPFIGCPISAGRLCPRR